MAGRGVESPAKAGELGPFERWLVALLDDILESGFDRPARTVGVDLSAPSKLGDVRASVTLAGAGADRATWARLADAIGKDGRIGRVVAVPPTLYVTLARGVLEAGVAACASARPLIPPVGAGPGIVVVFCSPNTNKPLHIGHLRACFVGMSISRLFEETGSVVARSQMLSNFGIHMCQALAVHDGVSTPESSGLKGDHFVGALYRSYHDDASSAGAACDEGACRSRPTGDQCIGCRARELLRRMAAGDESVLMANRRLGDWAIEGILATQARVGTSHDTCLRESEVIGTAVQALHRAVEMGVCKRRADGSTYIPVSSTGESDLTLLRRDGTSLVFSMLLGVYLARSELYPGWHVVELTGEQWRAGRTAMYEVLRRIGREDLSAGTEGVFFGMVKRTGEVMRSRTGAVVVADELIDRTATRVRSWPECPRRVHDDEAACERLAVAMLKYHVLRFPRAKGFDFDEETMWRDATARLGAVRQALKWAERPPTGRADEAEQVPEVRRMALVMARQSACAGRALEKRDPAVMVRYADELAEAALKLARRRVTDPTLRRTVSEVLRRSLALLDIDAIDVCGT